MDMKHPFQFGKDTLTPGIALRIARGQQTGTFADDTINKIKKSHADVAEIANGDRVVYGINTGFGPALHHHYFQRTNPQASGKYPQKP